MDGGVAVIVDSGAEAVGNIGVCVEAVTKGGVPWAGTGVRAEQEARKTKTQNVKCKR